MEILPWPMNLLAILPRRLKLPVIRFYGGSRNRLPTPASLEWLAIIFLFLVCNVLLSLFHELRDLINLYIQQQR